MRVSLPLISTKKAHYVQSVQSYENRRILFSHQLIFFSLQIRSGKKDEILLVLPPLPDRLMVGRDPLEVVILVRVQVRQQFKKLPREFFV